MSSAPASRGSLRFRLSTLFMTVLVLSAVLDPISAMFFPALSHLLFGHVGDDVGDFYEPGFGGHDYLDHLRELQFRVTALEANARSGAVGGCESGVIGPLNSAQSTGTITFRRPFLTPPAISLALSDLQTTDQNAMTGFTIRPVSVSKTAASVRIAPLNANVAALFVSYMACPSNAAPVVTPSNLRG
ncbi:hypothetical protein PoB_004568700 [Plakobranchus ocellatus]|uniref:H-type lectin domain-containing protein n=1 Tax=Plakobranchus ocellatus TaxID=259542 RepID=A0AAV4BIH4_9GAST|nr:hypothetical protein PoB_004568700 [Plakobranchus ocellatus]